MRAVVTGGAGFIGSTLVERLLGDGHQITVVDSLTDYYEPGAKRANLAAIEANPAATVLEQDLLGGDLAAVIEGADVVWHLAGQPGVRLSWSEGFADYEARN